MSATNVRDLDQLLYQDANARLKLCQVSGMGDEASSVGICVLPEHLHLLMTLPREDADFATRIMLIKQGFSRRVPQGERISASHASKGERGLWQRRYWEHLIRDDADFERHVDYIHFNPVKHGWVKRATDWPHSSIHRFIREGVLDASWAGVGDTEISAGK